jgi:hypothetical protein
MGSGSRNEGPDPYALNTVQPQNDQLQTVFRIHDILGWIRIRIRGSMPLTNGSGSPDPDPAIFVIDLQDASKKLNFNTIFSAYYFLKVHLHHFSKIKSQKGSIPLTSGSGSGRPKNMWIRWIRIRNTRYKPSSYQTSIYKTSSYRMSRLPNV